MDDHLRPPRDLGRSAMKEGFQVRIASDTDLASAIAGFHEFAPRLTGYRREMLDHPIAGRSLRHYIILTECPELLDMLGLSATERFWSRYYWLARFAREWNSNFGYDAGVEQQVFQLLESDAASSVAYELLPEIEAAVERDAVIRPEVSPETPN